MTADRSIIATHFLHMPLKPAEYRFMKVEYTFLIASFHKCYSDHRIFVVILKIFPCNIIYARYTNAPEFLGITSFHFISF